VLFLLTCVTLFHYSKGHTIKADISKYQTTNNEYTSFLTFAWAMVADLDFESEIIRFVGEARFHLWAVLRILALRRYPAKFSYLPPPSSNDKSNKPLDNNMPALTSPVPANWVTIEDNFIVFWVSQVPKASVNDLQSPKSTLDDGVFRAFIIRGNVSRFQLIKCLLHLDTGGHIDQDCVEYIECVAYRLEPTAPGSYNDIDGEKVEDGPIQAHVIRGCMRVFAGKPVAL
jgi:sphingosine kinase